MVSTVAVLKTRVTCTSQVNIIQTLACPILLSYM